MLNTDYVKKEADLLDKIAKTLRGLDETVGALNEADGKAREDAEKKAMREIRTFTKQVNKLDNIEGQKIESDDYGTPEEYAKQNQALRDIRALCGSIHEEAGEVTTQDVEPESKQALTDALANMRQILRMIGKYDDYSEDERDRIIKGV